MKDRAFGFRFRAFTTLIVVLGFAALLVSGGVLFLSPPGRVANWTQWQILGLTKHGWSDLHVVFSALFLVAGVVHLAFNWRPLLHHLGARMAGKVGFRPEWVAAILVGIAVFAGTRAKVAPISTLLAWSEQLRNGWEQPQERAPIPHAELLTLGELAKQAGVAPEEALRRLESKGIQGAALDRQVQLIADAARVTPARVYEIIGSRDVPSAAGSEAGHSAKGPGAGGGPGWMTLEKYCAEQKLDLTTVQAALTKRGIRFTADQTLREIAVGNGFDRPYGLLEIIRQK